MGRLDDKRLWAMLSGLMAGIDADGFRWKNGRKEFNGYMLWLTRQKVVEGTISSDRVGRRYEEHWRGWEPAMRERMDEWFRLPGDGRIAAIQLDYFDIQPGLEQAMVEDKVPEMARDELTCLVRILKGLGMILLGERGKDFFVR